MANLRDRGQIILVAAFALAVIFIALALIVNSAIFTENLASRGETSGSDGALSMRAMVEESAGSNLERVNRQGANSYGALENDMDDSLSELSTQIGRQQARNGRLVNVSDIRDTNTGTRIHEDGPNDQLASSDFTVVTGVSRANPEPSVTENGTRAFRITETDITGTDSSNPFTITATGTSTWSTDIYQKSSGSDTVVVDTNNGNGDTNTCEVTVDDRTQFEIDITDGTIDDQPCSALRRTGSGENFAFAGGVGDSYAIDFTNPNLVEGQFSMTVNSVSTINTPGDVTANNALYSVTVRYGYSTSDLTYVSDVRVAPGEPDE
jgi:hypothetical protein